MAAGDFAGFSTSSYTKRMRVAGFHSVHEAKVESNNFYCVRVHRYGNEGYGSSAERL